MHLLADGVPLSLLLDLFLGPRSEDLMAHEAGGQRRPAERSAAAPVG